MGVGPTGCGAMRGWTYWMWGYEGMELLDVGLWGLDLLDVWGFWDYCV